MVAGGGCSTAGNAGKRKVLAALPPPSSPSSKKRKPNDCPPLLSSDLTHLLTLLTSSISLSLRFLSSNSLYIPPALSIPLECTLHSTALSLSHLLSLLPLPLQTHILTSLSPAPSLTLPSSWFLNLLSSPSSPSLFLPSFHLSHSSFYLLLKTLNLSFTSLPPEYKLGCFLFRLSHAAPYRTVARRFGLPSSKLACLAFYEVCHSIVHHLRHLLNLTSDISAVTQGFHPLSLPNCCGVLAYSQFPIESEKLGGGIIAQGLVDSDTRFLDLSVGWHGSMNPSEILPHTKLFKSQSISPPRYILGGSSSPLLPWLITPYKTEPNSLSFFKDGIFNDVHKCGMELARRAFRQVHARWRLLIARWKEGTADALPYVVVAGCLLHNFLVNCGEPTFEEVRESVEGQLGFGDFKGDGEEGGKRMRDALASHLSQVRRD